MTVYLGMFGRLTLQRKSNEGAFESVINPSDVNTTSKRFSFDFDQNFLITGDHIEITSTDGSALNWISTAGWANGVKQSSGKWFVYVDELGGIRLYSNFAYAVNGGVTNAIALDSFNSIIPISVVISNAQKRILGAITEYELNTQREAIDTTALSEQFRSQWSSLMSGSGRIGCLWDYKDCCGGGQYETAQYLMQLALRTEVGSEFTAQLFLKTEDYNAGNAATGTSAQIWYEIDGIITASAVQFSADTVIQLSADFITTGPIRLLVKTEADNLVLQENADEILLDQDATARLAQEADG
tara:strand:- start:2368 stop:3264 length:897 start_codon:yes stop_codon:yes gene_type:complete